MTPALKAMVEAMAAEALRQNTHTGMIDHDGELTSIMGESIWVDLEKVARAALEAIREPTKEQAVAGQDALDECVDSDYDSDADGNTYPYTTISPSAPAAAYRAMIEAILKETP